VDEEIGPWEVLAFACELGMIAALAVGGWNLGRHGLDGGALLASALAVCLPLAAAAVWGRWLAPRATGRLTGGALLAAQAAVFACASVVLALPPGEGHPVWAAALLVVSLVDLGVVEGRRRRSRRPAGDLDRG
jgi:hypothetical protein